MLVKYLVLSDCLRTTTLRRNRLVWPVDNDKAFQYDVFVLWVGSETPANELEWKGGKLRIFLHADEIRVIQSLEEPPP
jgi:hypothetical protein